MVQLKVSRENDKVVIPNKREGDAGYDAFIDPVWFEEKYKGYLKIKPRETVMLSTGIRTQFSSDYYLQFEERGSTGTIAMKYGAGVVDSNFTGVLNVIITNCGDKDIILYDEKSVFTYTEDGAINYPISKAVAQFVMLPVPKVEVIEVYPESIINRETERGENMLGSTNKI